MFLGCLHSRADGLFLMFQQLPNPLPLHAHLLLAAFDVRSPAALSPSTGNRFEACQRGRLINTSPGSISSLMVLMISGEGASIGTALDMSISKPVFSRISSGVV